MAKTPDQVSGLTGWWKADAGVYEDAGTDPAETGDGVYQWNDQSGNGRHLTQSTSGNRPTYRTDIYSKPVVKFDGTNDVMTNSTALSSFIAAGAGTIFIVARPVPNTSTSTYYDGDTMFCDSNAYIGLCAAITSERFAAYNYVAGIQSAVKTQTISDQLHIFLWNHDSGNVRGSVDDARTASLASTASGNTTMTGSIRVGSNYSGAVFTDVEIAEIAVWNVAVSEADRKEIEVGLANKYGITLPYSIATTYTETGSVSASSSVDGDLLFQADLDGATSATALMSSQMLAETVVSGATPGSSGVSSLMLSEIVLAGSSAADAGVSHAMQSYVDVDGLIAASPGASGTFLSEVVIAGSTAAESSVSTRTLVEVVLGGILEAVSEVIGYTALLWDRERLNNRMSRDLNAIPPPDLIKRIKWRRDQRWQDRSFRR